MFGKKNAGNNGLNIIIVGCGKVGSKLAERLSNEEHDITVINANIMAKSFLFIMNLDSDLNIFATGRILTA